MAFAIPLLGAAGPWVAAGGAALQGINQSNALSANAAIYGQEGRIAAAQGYEAEAQQRRRGALEIGREVAAAGQSGGGYQGSTGAAIGQSAVNAELDALNIRYKAQLQKWGYSTQSQMLKDEARSAQVSGWLGAGAQLLKGFSNNYTAPGVTNLG